ncbi:MAG: hypothetical protein H6Q86_1997 [candidate division NC10 bacterium]|jgi:hypothetical protein|nr:hypothetical protein [candidate division NC10 bacterium]
MGQAIGESIVLAVGVAFSPMAIMPVVLMLGTPRGRVTGPAFTAGWLVGLSLAGATALAIAGGGGQGGDPGAWLHLVKLALGGLLVLLAFRKFLGRPKDDTEAAMPAWLGAIDRLGAPKAFGAGGMLSAGNPKNLLLVIAAAAEIAQAEIPGGKQAVALAVFAVIGTLGAAVPVGIYFALGSRAADLLDRLKGWMARNNAVIVAVLLLLIGAKLVGASLAGLAR